jgi:hypothetical protein
MPSTWLKWSNMQHPSDITFEIPKHLEPILNDLRTLFGNELDFVVVSLPNLYEIKAWRRATVEGENLWTETWESNRLTESDHLERQEKSLISKLVAAGFSID